MKGINKNSGELEFTDVKLYVEPYPHVTVGNVFDPRLADMVLNWLKVTHLWKPQNASTHKSSAFNINHSIIPDNLACLFSGKSLLNLLTKLEELFNDSFEDKFIITAFKHVEGQGTAIHTDFEVKFPLDFTHRFIVYFNDDWIENDGGILGLFQSGKVTDLVKTINPIHNTGVGLIFGPSSYHAVSAVTNKVRYSLVFSLLSKSGKYKGV
ncbi:2OG-Fe(II) oxygenase [Cytobacillus oceanisediminis]|uniref:2OG-Fe(II) oxygenase n=1 Tax=Cytobacillus oceanisediminis TaxID=665099 RepID=UPI001C22A25D|nr:2OG-Fe(II) oxygenase [Cytobacillus oceanisediminis]MBU8772025.1 2OG-Fe(II) oxygenase [Cytobacillus oceanisediminis]